MGVIVIMECIACRVSDESGSLEMTLVTEGNITRDYLDPKDVFILDTGKAVFVWIGSGASPAEKKNAMTYAHVNTHVVCSLQQLTSFSLCRTI